MTDNTEELKHYGVPGMKWGKRKASSSSPAKLSKDHKAVAKLRTKDLSEMNNDEIQTLTRRLNLEKQYKDLSPSKFTKGQKKVGAVLAVVGTVNAIAALPKSPAGKLIKKGVKAYIESR